MWIYGIFSYAKNDKIGFFIVGFAIFIVAFAMQIE